MEARWRSGGPGFATALLIVAVALAGCSGGGIPRGSGLRADTLGGAISFTRAEVGGRYGIAFPVLTNKTGRPITIEHVRLVNVPSGIRVIGYRALTREGPAAVYTSYEGSGSAEDYLRYPDIFRPGRTKLPPHSSGLIFFAADIRWVRFTRKLISGCEVTYETWRGDTFRQTFDCEYRMTDAP